jgi:hypothetical protein
MMISIWVFLGGVFVGLMIGFWAGLEWMGSSELTGEHDYLTDYPHDNPPPAKGRQGVA